MKTTNMHTITKQVPVSEVPQQWRAGLSNSALIKVTLETVPEKPSSRQVDRQKIIQQVAGIWKDREDISALYEDMRQADKTKLDSTIPKN